MPDKKIKKTDRPLTPEEVEELAQIIHSWSADDTKKYMQDPELAQAANNVLDAQKQLRERRNQ